MPFYEYLCQSCNLKFEQFVKTMTDDTPDCPKCGGKVSRQFSVFGVGAAQPEPASRCGSCAQSGSCPMSGR